VIELTEHLERSGQPVMLVASGGEQTPSMLMKASRGMRGAETDILQHYDIRECRPFTADELRPALAAQLAQGRVRADPAAMQTLLDSVNGSPQRLQRLGAEAVEYGQRWPHGVTQDVASAAVNTVDDRSKYIYKATWDNSTQADKDLITRAAASSVRGLSVPSVKQQAGPEKWGAVEDARQSLVDRGVMRESGGRMRFADPGMERWAAQHAGDSIAHQAVRVQQVLNRQQQTAPQAIPQTQPYAAGYPAQQQYAGQPPAAQHGGQPSPGQQGARPSQTAQGCRHRAPDRGNGR
jgi:hypothetical protein